jgi:hypothetical protein
LFIGVVVVKVFELLIVCLVSSQFRLTLKQVFVFLKDFFEVTLINDGGVGVSLCVFAKVLLLIENFQQPLRKLTI